MAGSPTRLGRGVLRIYLGAAPGVGKTFKMLDEGHRRRARGTDVVIAYVESHRRVRTEERIGDLEQVPRRSIPYRDSTFEEMDVDAVLARRPQVALVDELAHTNVPGSRHAKRWQDVDDLLAAGIDVISTVNVQHLESLNDVIEGITGIRQQETLPDAIVRSAEQIELVDITPEALRRRMAHGNIYPADRVDAALANYFRPGNLSALRELALLWVADRVEESLQSYMEGHGIRGTWETRERVVVAVTGVPGGERLVRRAGRLASRLGGELYGVHVVAADGLATSSGPALDAHRHMIVELGGTYREVVGDDVPSALVTFARTIKATQMVLGASRRAGWRALVRPPVVTRVATMAKTFDLHVLAEEAATDEGRRRRVRARYRARRSAVASPARSAAAWVATVIGLPLVTAVLARFRHDITLTTDLLLYLLAAVGIATLGGAIVGVAAAVTASLLANWFFVPPIHTFTIGQPQNLTALLVFVAASLLVGGLVNRAAARSREAFQARAEAETLARTSGILIGENDPLPALLAQIRATFAVGAVAVMHREDDAWVPDAVSGDDPPTRPTDGDRWDLADDGSAVLVLRDAQLSESDQRVLGTFLSNLAIALRGRRLQQEAAAAEHLAEVDAFRTALLQAVSHDLRTPLASIKASATSLLQRDVTFGEADRREFLEAIDGEADRLNRIVGNLLDMSRLRANAVQVDIVPVYLDDVVAAALASLDHPAGRVAVRLADTLPPVAADAPLLERAVANIIANAIAWSPPDAPVRVEAAETGSRVVLRIVDQGPGVPPEDRERVFEPFQRLGDKSTQAGVGLGLAVARGFVRAIGGDVHLDDAPGGGLAVEIDLAAAAEAAAVPAPAAVPASLPVAGER